MNFTTKYWMEIIVVEILLIGNTAGNLSLASPPLLTIQIRFVTGIEALSLFHSLEWKVGGGGDWWVIQILSDRDDQCILLGLNIISILEFLGEERFGEYFLCVLN